MRWMVVAMLMVGACGSATMGDLCTDAAFYYCKRALDGPWCPRPETAETEETHLECQDAFVRMCCAGNGSCDDEIPSDAPDECSADIRAQSCEMIASGPLPVSCLAP